MAELQEIVNSDLDNLMNLLPKYDHIHSSDDSVEETEKKKEADETNMKVNLVNLITREDEDFITNVVALCQEGLKQGEKKKLENPKLALSFLNLACKLDAVKCAKALLEGEIGLVMNVNGFDYSGRTALHSAAENHAKKCVELLLSKKARTDLKSRNSDAYIALESALSSKRMVVWDSEESVEDLLVNLNKIDLSAVKMLAEATKDVSGLAYNGVMEGKIEWLAALLMVVPEEISSLIMVLRPDGVLAYKEATTIYECVIREALSSKEGKPSGARRFEGIRSERRKFLLGEIELLQLFGATLVERVTSDKRGLSPLIRASQAGGDIEVVRLLLKTNIDVNETDGDGNSALHWYLKSSSNNEEPRIAWLLMKHGASIRLKNKLGLTPLHLAAANGNLQALQILLFRDPAIVDSLSVMKESPLFYAVKNDSMNCAKLLLRYGANTQLLNLRKQRPIDFSRSADMRFMLSQTDICWSRSLPAQENYPSWIIDEESDSDGETSGAILKAQANAISPERLSPFPKSEICKYYRSPGGCARGDNCFYQHGEGKLPKCRLQYPKQRTQIEELKLKVFVGGLPPSIDSDILHEHFQKQYGPVKTAVVIEDDQAKSKGFGFVTFQLEESAAAAAQAHYVRLAGKKVEIKAVVSKPCTVDHSETYGEERTLEPPPPWVDKLMHGEKQSGPEDCQNQLNEPIGGDQNLNQSLPSWFLTFKKWFPGFLTKTLSRLKEGEWYALSSLKSDFRATCGLELNHTSLGFQKLSDFILSCPDICRMETVPVSGHGLASHMVLLPKHPSQKQEQQLLTASIYHQLRSSNNVGIVCSGGGTSSGATGQQGNSAAREGKDSDGADSRHQGNQTYDGQSGLGNESNRGQDGDEGNDKYKQLKELTKNTEDHFSFFAREYDFYEKCDNLMAEKKCFKCSAKLDLLQPIGPCGHYHILCKKCDKDTNPPGNAKICLVCNQELKRPTPVKSLVQKCDNLMAEKKCFKCSAKLDLLLPIGPCGHYHILCIKCDGDTSTAGNAEVCLVCNQEVKRPTPVKYLVQKCDNLIAAKKCFKCSAELDLLQPIYPCGHYHILCKKCDEDTGTAGNAKVCLVCNQKVKIPSPVKSRLERYNDLAVEKKCLNCKAEMYWIWENQPCGHFSLLCQICDYKTITHGHGTGKRCVICNQPVKSSNPAESWRQKYYNLTFERKCFRCDGELKLPWINVPCRHHGILCYRCINARSIMWHGLPVICMICDQVVERSNIEEWPKRAPLQKPPDTSNQAEFPVWDAESLGKRPKKKRGR